MTTSFSTGAAVHPAVRRAALTLYAANTEDREWVMLRLGSGDRPLLEKMLVELASLGIPRDFAMVRSALRESPGSAQACADAPQNLAQFLQIADAEVLANLLLREPPTIVAFALGLMPVAAGATVLDRLPPGLRRDIQTIRDTESAEVMPPRLQAALLKQLQSRLPPPTSSQARWAGLWRRCAAALRMQRRQP